SIILPTDIAGKQVKWKKNDDPHGPMLAVFGVIIMIAVTVGQKEDKKKKKKARMKELSIDYPDILSKLSLYIGAGFSVKKSFENIAAIYNKDILEKRRTRTAGYEGICELVRRIEDGAGEMEAYRYFAVKMDHKDYRKLVLLLTQNIKKGSRDLIDRLNEEETNAFEERKARAKIAGEEASTKLLLPMMGLLGVVMLVLIVPALMNMNI
ncbi:MAG: hypothetical protein K6F00_09395, partial [Lachnospiraceae bacterium]|nr:hypothetical protein [Lachnospiraceae bacterium]